MKLGVQPIHRCGLYATIYGNSSKKQFDELVSSSTPFYCHVCNHIVCQRMQ